MKSLSYVLGARLSHFIASMSSLLCMRRKSVREKCNFDWIALRRGLLNTPFPSEASLLRLMTARLMDLSEEWKGNSGRAYISPEKLAAIAEVLKSAAPQPTPNIAE